MRTIEVNLWLFHEAIEKIFDLPSLKLLQLQCWYPNSQNSPWEVSAAFVQIPSVHFDVVIQSVVSIWASIASKNVGSPTPATLLYHPIDLESLTWTPPTFKLLLWASKGSSISLHTYKNSLLEGYYPFPHRFPSKNSSLEGHQLFSHPIFRWAKEDAKKPMREINVMERTRKSNWGKYSIH